MRKNCLNQFIGDKLYMYCGPNFYTLKYKKFLRSFISNDVFKADSPLHKSIFYQHDSPDILLSVMENLRVYIVDFGGDIQDWVLRPDGMPVNFKELEDAIFVLNLLRFHFTWRYEKDFNGKPVSVLENNYIKYADEPIENRLVMPYLLNARLNGNLGHEFDMNYILCHKTSNKNFYDQFIKNFDSDASLSCSKYDGLILFNDAAMNRFIKFIDDNDKFASSEISKDDEGYMYISFGTQMTEEYNYIKFSSYKMVCHIEAEGAYKLVGFSASNFCFDKDDYKDLPQVHRSYCIDEKIQDFLNVEDIKIVTPTHIDVFV